MNVLNVYESFKKIPFGKSLFSFLTCTQAPYFHSIRPLVQELSAGYCEVSIKERRRVRNHINTIHAIALCNICELSMGLAVESKIPKQLRWLPKGMNVEYKSVGKGKLTGVCDIRNMELKAGEQHVVVNVLNEQKQLVTRATIILHVTEKR